ncbi:MAG: type VI secretion system contractile sheath large subunit, partial [Pseudomonadota bacterium]
NAEDMIARFRTTLTLPIGEDGAGVEVALNSLDDLHPDELYDNVDMFEELSTLRRRVSSGRDLDRVVAEMKAWGEEFGDIKLHARKRAKGVAVPADRRLSDFQQLIGDMREPQVEASDADDLIQRIVGPHIVAAADPQQETMVKMLDDALSAAMRTVLHHPDFQAVESLWRSLDLLARRIETSASMEIVLYDVSAEEWAGDLSAQDEMGESGLYKMLVEEPRLDAQHGPLSAVFGLYTLEETPPHAELMARMAKICAHMQVPFVTSISPQFLQTPKKDRHPLTAKTWDALRALPEASYVGLVSPRFLLRLPYGQKTEPVYPFEFEEFTLREGLKGMLWANPVVLVAILMAETARTTGKKMELGKIMSLGDMPFHFMTDEYGDQVGLPCTERLLNTTTAAEVVARGFMPVLSMKGQNQVRLGSFQSLGKGQIAGVWAPVAVGAAAGASVEMSAGEPAPSGADDSGLGDAGEDDVATGDDDLGLDDLDSGGDDSDDLGDLDDLLADFGDDAGGDEDDTDLDAELAALLGDL